MEKIYVLVGTEPYEGDSPLLASSDADAVQARAEVYRGHSKNRPEWVLNNVGDHAATIAGWKACQPDGFEDFSEYNVREIPVPPSAESTRTLDQITTAARQGLPVTETELRLAVCAYDVLMAKLKVPENPVQLAEYFKAADTAPELYLGPNNDPRELGVKEWHEAFIND